jgi:deazaflavin-dependent oxidoreductase (nitroreductase family)
VSIGAFLVEHADHAVCWLQTTGRRSGRQRTIEIWFATDGSRIYFLAGGREHAHWVRNLRADPRVRVRLAGRTIAGLASVVEGADDETTARQLLAAKYQGWSEGRPMSSWAAGSLPVRVDPESG